MKTLRERNNLSSKLSNEKALERKYAEDYEYEVIRVQSKLPDTAAHHWSKTPEEWLYNAGYITDFNKHRYQRLMAKKEEREGINRLKDYGADGISRRKDETGNYIYDLIQAKYYISRKVTAGDIGTFLATTINLMIKEPKSKGYIYSSSPLQIDLADCVANPAYPIRHILLPWKHPDGRTLKKVIEVSEERDLPLRDYQKNVLKALPKNGINALNIPCRMGKTLLLGHHLLSVVPQRIILIAPLKVSVQNLKNRLTSFLPHHSSLLVDSDTDGTTNYEEVERFLKTNTQVIIYSTFDSALNILNRITEVSPELLKYGFIGVDEVHNVNNELCEFINKFKTGLVMSATMPEELLEQLHINERIYISFSDGINGGWITDYNLWVPYLTKKEDDTTFVDVDIPNDFKSYNVHLSAKGMYLATVMLQTGSRRCIAYLNSQEECDQFMEIIRAIFENYHGADVWTDKIDSTVSHKKREEVLEDFQHGHPDTTFHILTSVRILDEAVDIPRCDSEFIAHVGERSSDIRMLQRSQRGSTLDSKNPSKVNNVILWADGWEKCIDSLELLKETDPEFHKKLRVCNANYDSISDKQLIKNIELQTSEMREWSLLRCVSLWERKRLEWEKFYKENGRRPSQYSINSYEKQLGNWQSNQKGDYRNKKMCMTEERIKALEATEGWKWKEDIWEQKRQEWESFYRENGCCPSGKSKLSLEKCLGSWQSQQRTGYKTRETWMTEERIKALEGTEGWKWKEDDTWEQRRQEWERFLKDNGRNPSKASKNSKEKRLGNWQSIQRKNYREKEKYMTEERIKALEATEGWKWKEDDTWEQIRQKWERFYRDNRIYPLRASKNSDEKYLGEWQASQRKDYKNKEKYMTEERIKALEATEGWKWKEDTWDKLRQEWERFYIENGRMPSQTSKNTLERQLGCWQSQQRNYYKNKEKCMTKERIKKLEETEGWKWDEGDTWEQIRQEWIQFWKDNGKTPSENSKKSLEKQLGRWQAAQRHGYRKKTTCMTEERIKALEATEGWKWDESNVWEQIRQEWDEFYRESGRSPSRQSKNLLEKRLGQWQSDQRKNYKNKKNYMTEKRIKSLESTEGWKWSK
jgi:superfamily II DNA or RNA helicase